MLQRIEFPVSKRLLRHQNYYESVINPLIDEINACLAPQLEAFEQVSTSELMVLIYFQLRPLAYQLSSLEGSLEQAINHPPLFAGRAWHAKQEALQNAVKLCQLQLQTLDDKLAQTLWQRTQDQNVPPASDLNDDLRIQIYDYLKSQGFLKGDLESIIQSVRQVSYKPPKCSKSFKRYSIEVENKLKQWSQDSVIFDDSPTEPSSSFTLTLPDPLSNALDWLGVTQLWHQLYPFRYGFYLGLTAWIASSFLSPLQPLFLLLGQNLGNILFSLCFSTLLFSPLIYAAFQYKPQITQSFKQFILKDTLEPLLKTMDTLRFNQALLKGELARGVLDTRFYEVKDLEKLFNKLEQEIAETLPRLVKPNRLVSWFYPNLDQVIEEARAILQRQPLFVQERRGAYCDHLVQRLKADTQKMIKDFDHSLQPMMSPDQINKIRAFLQQYGSPNQHLQLLSPPTEPFLTKIKRQGFYSKAHYGSKLLWGGSVPDQAALKGWAKLFEFYHALGSQKLALGLAGNWHQDQTLAGYDSTLRSAAQDHIFACLDHLPRHYVLLLKNEHQQEILAWFKQHQSELEKTEQYLNQLIDDDGIHPEHLNLWTDQEASKTVWLLDHALFAYELMKKPKLSHQIRELFASNTGARAETFYLLRFFSDSERSSMTALLASQRLNWMLNNPGSAKITLPDIQLFLSPLLADHDDFNFHNLAVEHIKNCGPNPQLQALLLKFQNRGLVDASLMDYYLQLQPNDLRKDNDSTECSKRSRKVSQC